MRKKKLNKTDKAVTILTILGIFFFFSCSPAKRLSDEEYLYNRSRIVMDNGAVDKSVLTKYQRISPNKRVLGVRFHLFLYNLANPEKEVFPHAWLRKIGEPPVIYDSLLIQQNSKNFSKYVSDKGYNSAKVTEQVHRKKGRKIDLVYQVELGEPTIINSVKYNLEDPSIKEYIFNDTNSALIKAGDPLDKPKLQAERLRIEALLKNQGYFKFSREYIFYEVAKVNKANQVDLTVNIKQNVSGNIDPVTKARPHKKYKISEVNIYPNLDKREEIGDMDTASYNNHQVYYYGPPMLRASTLADANRSIPGSLYSLKNTERTYSNYSSLGLFQFINISYVDGDSKDEEYGEIGCNIELAMRKRQSYAFELVATSSDNDPGIRGNITYNNYNIFRGGEQLQVGVSGALESLRNRMEGTSKPMREFGITSKFETPKFLLPFSAPEFQRKYNPRTSIQISYNNQRQPYYRRTIANASFGYNWKGNAYNKHSIYPIDFYLVSLPTQIDSAYFVDHIKETRLENSFIDHAILGVRYSFEFSNQTKEGRRNFIYLKSNIESAGIGVYTSNRISSWGEDSLFFNVPYFQYAKADIDYRQYHVITPRNKVVFRLFAGIGIPYGNSATMPFEKMYWAGGPYGIRAWSERSLGPGAYPADSIRNQLGDIKLEANLEYRFKLFWKLEGAFFLDVGNVWLLDPQRKTWLSVENNIENIRVFYFNRFWEQIAIGTGFGTRFDFSFILLRFDFGFKLRDPSIQPNTDLRYDGDEPYYKTGSRWTISNPDPEVRFWNLTFQFGIGYPF